MTKKLTPEEVSKLVVEAGKLQNQYKALRTGQAMYNTLSDMNEELANEVNGTEYDPFYNDARIGKFLQYITQQ